MPFSYIAAIFLHALLEVVLEELKQYSRIKIQVSSLRDERSIIRRARR